MKLKNIIYIVCFFILPFQIAVNADVTASGNVVVYNAVLGSANPALNESWSWFQLSGVDSLSTCPSGDKGAGDLVYIALPESEKLATTLLLSAYGGGLELVAEVDDTNLFQGYCRLSQLALAPIAVISSGGTGGGSGGAHRFWRINTIQLGASLLEISEIELSLADNSSLNSLATITFSSGNAAPLHDNNVNSNYWWEASVVTAPGFYMQWDFGATPQAVSKVRQAGFDNATRYIQGFSLQYSDDGINWTTQGAQSGLIYPGNHTYSEYYDVSQ
ncbi:hypothetical protein [Aurantivibrio infirmus]